MECFYFNLVTFIIINYIIELINKPTIQPMNH